MSIDADFEQLWDTYGDRLLDRQQQALLRCWRDAPEKVIALFETYIEQRAGHPSIDQHLDTPPQLVIFPAPIPTRRCCHCGGTNYRQKAKLCYACYRQRYLLQKDRRAA